MKPFYEQPVLNSPYHVPSRHHALGEDGQPLEQAPINGRRRSRYMVPVPRSRKQRPRNSQEELLLDDAGQTTTYNPSVIVNEIRSYLDAWRSLPDPHDWGVTPTTQRLLLHWRKESWSNQRPFFCQLEAIETIIWLSEVARGKRQYAAIFRTLEAANAESNPELFRLAMKLATGAGSRGFRDPAIDQWKDVGEPAALCVGRLCRGPRGAVRGWDGGVSKQEGWVTDGGPQAASRLSPTPSQPPPSRGRCRSSLMH